MQSRAKTSVALLSLSLSGCTAHIQTADSEQLVVQSQRSSAASDDSMASAAALRVEESPLDSDINDPAIVEQTLLSAGFCRDDIYTSYLTREYQRHNGAQFPAPKSRSASRLHRQWENQSLHFAASRLKGQSSPYFGGLPVVMNQSVEYWIRYFKTTGRGPFLKWAIRGEGLRTIVESILRNEGVPSELYYLAMVESGFNNRAFSRARATGTWQFMESTARLYGLKVDYWVDERRDPAKATVAATRYLKELYGKFGDWHLAIAAYNAGPGKIANAIRRSGKRDFWAIAQTPYITEETKNYVPKVLAAVTLAANPEANGFQVNADPADDVPTSTVYVNRPILLSEIAGGLSIPLEQLRNWNPELIHDLVPPESAWRGKPGYQLRIPRELKERFAELEPTWTILDVQDFHLHRVGRGETLAKIAKKYQVPIARILGANPDLSPRKLKVGRQLTIPLPSAVVTRRKTLS